MNEDETDFGLDDIIPAAVSRVAKNGRKKKNDLEMEKLKKRTSLKSMRYIALDLNQVLKQTFVTLMIILIWCID